MKHIKRFNESDENSNISNINESKLHGNLRIDLSDFERLSREVGFYNCMSNIKDEEDRIDPEMVSKYEELRDKQLIMFEEILEFYSK
jgi:hypothetical protein